MDKLATELKHCWCCDGTFPRTTEFFHRDSSKSDGLHGSCKVCTCDRKRKWQKEHPPAPHPVVGRIEIITALHENFERAAWKERFVEIE